MRPAARAKIAAAAATCTVVVVLALGPTTGLATTLVPLTVEEMTEMATSVIVAEAEDVTSRPLSGPAGAASLSGIETDVSLRVTQTLKGAPQATAEFTVAGGRLGDTGYLATWEPTLRPGERAIFFLDNDGRPLGPQAKLTVSDGRVQSLDRDVADVMTEVLGAEPLGPIVGERPEFVAVSAKLPSPASFTMPAQSVHIDDGFETGTLDPTTWSLYDGGLGATWTISTQEVSSGSYSLYCDDEAPAGGPYTTNTYSWLYTTTPLDLSSATSAFLTYDYFLDSDSPDTLSVVYSTGDDDGDTFLDFYGFLYATSPGTWNTEEVDLSSFPVNSDDLIGEPEVWIAFIWESDASANTAEGAYLDNVRVVEDPDGPVISNINPPSGSAGTDTEVTITGTGFGAVQGSGSVDFTYDEIDGTTIEGTVTSWSDTEIRCIIPIVQNPSAYPGAAGTGPVTVTSGLGGTSNGYAFSVTFAYGGIKWSASAAPYRFNANTPDTPNEQAFFDNAAQTWTDVSVFSFPNAGSTTTNDYTNNGINEVFWTNTSLPSSVLAAAGIWYTGDEIEECDIGFNDTKLWGSGSGGSYDIQTIAVHELGHWLNLRDLYGNGDSDKIMYGYGSPSGQKRDLSAGDIEGIRWIYETPVLDIDVTAEPAIALPSQPITYTYTVSNIATISATDVTITDSRFGQIGSTLPTLAPAAVMTETFVYGGFASVGVRNNSVSVDATAGGFPVNAQTSVSVQVAVPEVEVTLAPVSSPVVVGTPVSLRYIVENTGGFTLSDIVVEDTGRGMTVNVSGNLAPGSTKTVRRDVTTVGPIIARGKVTASSSGYTVKDWSPRLYISTYERIAGTDRIDTAVRASKRAFPAAGSADSVVVASAYAWADALPASGLAGAVGGPLLLVSPNELPSAVASEISRLGASTVYIAGGTAVVSPAVGKALNALPGVTATRLGGTNRYGTARLIAQEMLDIPGADYDTAFVATGGNFPDALAASSLAAAMPAPILLTEKGSLPSDTRTALGALGPDTIVVCGGTAVVSSGVQNALGSYGTVVRRGGADRYETGRLVVDWGTTQLAPDGPTGVFLAVGTNYPDALAGGVVAARANGSWNPLMLTPADALDPTASSYMQTHSSVMHAGVLGGEAAVSASVLTSAKALLP